MYIKICDRCGRQTINKPAFLLPTIEEKGSYCVDNQWFGKPVCLCDECINDFDNFRFNHKYYKINFEEVNK
jgi:hypothetical protein